jgi:hypothetical protein
LFANTISSAVILPRNGLLVGPVEPGDVLSLSSPAETSAAAVASASSALTVLSSWVWRKNFKKEDLVIHHGFLYQAALDQPERRPVEPEIRDWQDYTLHELGPPGTSQIIAFGFAIQLTSLVLLALWWLWADIVENPKLAA